MDPSRDLGPYLAAAARRGLRLAYTAETHLHADFVSGSRELAARGATVLAPAAAGLEFPHRGVGDGEEVDLGGLSLRALATPGHTPEHLALGWFFGTYTGSTPRNVESGLAVSRSGVCHVMPRCSTKRSARGSGWNPWAATVSCASGQSLGRSPAARRWRCRSSHPATVGV